jgi:hypothetical protein
VFSLLVIPGDQDTVFEMVERVRIDFWPICIIYTSDWTANWPTSPMIYLLFIAIPHQKPPACLRELDLLAMLTDLA